jgi:hypothetical protein
MADVDDRFDIPPYIDKSGKIVGKRGNPGYIAPGKNLPDVRAIKSIAVFTADKDDNLDPFLFNIDNFLRTLPSLELVQNQFACRLLVE